MRTTLARGVRRATAVCAVAALAASALVGCGSDRGPSVYYMNFKPEQAQQFEDIAEEYTELTGVPVKVVTAASGSYMQTLKAEMAKSNAPTLFQINGQEGFGIWQDYLADISDYGVVTGLNDDVEPITDAAGVARAFPFAIEGFGLLYNEEIFDRYFAAPNPAVGSVEEIDGFDDLKAVAEDLQARKDEFGLDGAFASTSLLPGEEWRWTNHLMNGPLHYEIVDRDISEFSDMAQAEFTYERQFRQLFDLYLENSTVPPALATGRATSDAMAEFATGKAAMVQNGNWAWSQIAGVGGNVIKEDKIKFMPMYMGLPDEERNGLNVGTENYLAVNSRASAEDQQATRDFVEWLFLSERGKELVVDELGFIAPFADYAPDEVPADPLAQQVQAAIQDPESNSLPWDFQFSPNQNFRDRYGQNLAQYAMGNLTWQDVVDRFRDDWEYEMANQIALQS